MTGSRRRLSERSRTLLADRMQYGCPRSAIERRSVLDRTRLTELLYEIHVNDMRRHGYLTKDGLLSGKARLEMVR